jgi:hypothetical protein
MFNRTEWFNSISQQAGERKLCVEIAPAQRAGFTGKGRQFRNDMRGVEETQHAVSSHHAGGWWGCLWKGYVFRLLLNEESPFEKGKIGVYSGGNAHESRFRGRWVKVKPQSWVGESSAGSPVLESISPE